MENLLITDQRRFSEIEKKFQEGGLKNIHILADFDKTLTKAFVDGQEIPSIISILRDGNYLTPDYAIKANQLYDRYHPFESDITISKEEKKKQMAKWWTAHFELLIECGLRKTDIENIIKTGKLKFREGFLEFADFLEKQKVPLVIISSAGLGKESIIQALKQEKKLSGNIHIISNDFEWDKNGKAICTKRPIVHASNKDETLVSDFPDIFTAIKDRKNVILLGDNLCDTDMIVGFNYDNLLKIGFLNSGIEEKREAYQAAYDILLLNDSSLEFINDFLRKIPSE